VEGWQNGNAPVSKTGGRKPLQVRALYPPPEIFMVKIVGHRGAMGYAPENTLRSFRMAIDAHCDRTELDVRLSKDGEVIVIHDENVSRVTNGKGTVKNKTLIELKKLNCIDGQKLPTLQEVIDLCKGKINLQIELKVPGTPRAVHNLILKNNLIENVAIISFFPNLLREIKKLNPKLQVGLLFNKYNKKLWEYAKQIPLDFIGPRHDAVKRKIVERAHKLGMFVYVYHVNNHSLGKRLIALGVDELGTDFPRLFKDNI
jgi:glycerophosphoryl diester phosphodiesterase